MHAVLGLDLGTTYFKCAVVSRSGAPLGVSRVAVAPEHPHPGHAELSYQRFTGLIKAAVAKALAQSGCGASDILSISYSSQANTFALFDHRMLPLTPLVLWTDERTSDGSVSGSEPYDALRDKQIGDRAIPAKLLWFQLNAPSLWAQTAYVLTISDLLVYLLTGDIVGDASTASLTGMVSYSTLSYTNETITPLKLKESMLSRIVAPGTQIGPTRGELAAELGLPHNTILMAGNLDHVSAAIGAGIGVHTPASFSLGTVLAVMGITDQASGRQRIESDGLIAGPYPRPGSYFHLSFRDMGASTLEWYRNTFAADKTFAQLSDEAEATPPGCDGLIALPHVAHNLGNTRSIFIGTLHSGGAHADGVCVRAIMETTAVTLGELLHVVFGDAVPQHVAATGGGARSRLWLQIIADMTGAVVLRAEIEEPAAYGAAVHAAVGARWYSNIEDVAGQWLHETEEFRPDVETQQIYRVWKECNYENAKRTT